MDVAVLLTTMFFCFFIGVPIAYSLALAAIAGALLGAADGRASLPMRWIMPVLTCRPDAGLHPARPRPDEYWPDDLLDLTEALLLSRAPS